MWLEDGTVSRGLPFYETQLRDTAPETASENGVPPLWSSLILGGRIRPRRHRILIILVEPSYHGPVNFPRQWPNTSRVARSSRNEDVLAFLPRQRLPRAV